MPQSLTEIRDRIERYLAGDLSYPDMQRWFLPATWNIHQSADQALKDLVGELGLRFAEFEAGHWTETDLRVKLHALLSAPLHSPRP